MLKDNLERILGESGFYYSEYRGCFDIVARKKTDILLLKVLANIDSFQEEQAKNLKILSNTLNAFAALIGLRTRREELENNIIYDRFGITAITPKTLENILNRELPFLYRFRGGSFVEIDSDRLKKARMDKGLTQSELAERVGITKKCVYEHENKDMRSSYEVVIKIEKTLNADIKEPVSIRKDFSNIVNKPKERFERIVSDDLKKLGFNSSFVYQTPFNILAKEDFLVISDAEENQKNVEKKLPYMSGFSKVTKNPVLIVTRGEINSELPNIREKELSELSTKKELIRILKAW